MIAGEVSGVLPSPITDVAVESAGFNESSRGRRKIVAFL